MTRKTQANYYLPIATADTVRDRARKIGVSVNALVDLYLRHSEARLSDEALAKWAASIPSTQGRLAGGLTKVERSTFAAFDACAQRSEFPAATYCFGARELAHAAGVLPKEGFGALQALARRGLVEGAQGHDLDPWGRPVESFWWRAGGRLPVGARFAPPPESADEFLRQAYRRLEVWVDQGRPAGELYAVVLDLRALVRAHTSDPNDGFVELYAREAVGLSPQALRLRAQ
jgi:hypothetical protein